MRVALIGFMGAGKSTTARLLAKKLNWPAIEMDDLILCSSSYQSISEIIEAKGEEFFRDLETEVIKSISDRDQVVISTGGGAILRDANIEALRRLPTKIVFINTSFEEVCHRLKGDTQRPLFRDTLTAAELFAKRQARYRAVADFVVDSDGLRPDAVAEIIQGEVNQYV
jgi:shikimate kinase